MALLSDQSMENINDHQRSMLTNATLETVAMLFFFKFSLVVHLYMILTR
jgi:hypothetical protein